MRRRAGSLRADTLRRKGVSSLRDGKDISHSSKTRLRVLWLAVLVVLLLAAGAFYAVLAPGPGPSRTARPPLRAASPPPPDRSAADPTAGQRTFRYETFGNEYYFTDDLRLPFRLILALPATVRARTLGILTDVDGQVVGVREVEDSEGRKRWGVTCALCHSVVDRQGQRLDGVPNEQLNFGALLSLSPRVSLARKSVLLGWGRGLVDLTYMNEAEDGVNNASKTLPLFTKGLYYFGWNGAFDTPENAGHFMMDYVAHGQGGFRPKAGWHMVDKHAGSATGTAAGTSSQAQTARHDPAADPYEAAIAERDAEADIAPPDPVPDLIGPKMPDVAAYLDTLTPPAPPAASYDPVRAARGEALFSGKAGCARCHTPPLYTNNETVTPAAIGMNPRRATSEAFDEYTYKVPQLRGVWALGPYFHDGKARTLLDVVNHFSKQFGLRLTQTEKNDLVQFLKSLR